MTALRGGRGDGVLLLRGDQSQCPASLSGFAARRQTKKDVIRGMRHIPFHSGLGYFKLISPRPIFVLYPLDSSMASHFMLSA